MDVFHGVQVIIVNDMYIKKQNLKGFCPRQTCVTLNVLLIEGLALE